MRARTDTHTHTYSGGKHPFRERYDHDMHILYRYTTMVPLVALPEAANLVS